MSSPRGGSPGAEAQVSPELNVDDPNDLIIPENVDQSTTESTQAESVEDRPVEPVVGNDAPSANASITEDESRRDSDSDEDRLASQLSLLGAQLGAANEATAAGDGGNVAASFMTPPPAHPTFPPPRSTSHMDPLQHPINLNHSLPPTPREEHPDSDLGPGPTRSDRRRSTVTFREALEDDHASSTRGSAGRDYNLERQGSFPVAPVTGQRNTQRPPSESQDEDGNHQPEFVLPRWQPDAEVTYCPICQTQFSIFVRKHHCRKCGRVVCNSCSPHRIIIPHQYIVRPPGMDVPMPRGFLYEGLTDYMDGNVPSGGERVRLCNPCVPDPQTAPPQSPGSSTMGGGSIRSAHQRSRSSYTGNYGAVSSSSRYPGSYGDSRGGEQWRRYSAGTRSITMASAGRAGSSSSSSRMVHHGSLQRLAQPGSSYPSRHSSLAGASSSSRNRMLPPTPQIAEEDECPICHRELPSRDIPNFEAAREAHINACILNHSTYGSPRPPASGEAESAAPPPPLRRTGMYKYVATEKDCIDDAECTICLEEFTVGVGMARLECLCRFHRTCISAWFVNHPGRCPVHQHDGFGF